MITKKDIELQEVLDYCKLTTLPKEWNPETSSKIWVDAIVEVKKVNGTTSYAFVENKYGLEPRYKKIFGSMAMVVEILSYHPIHYLEKDFIINFKDMDELRKKIAGLYNLNEESMSKVKDEMVINMAYNYAIESQLVFTNQKGKDEYKQKKIEENEQLFKEITEGKSSRGEKKNKGTKPRQKSNK